MLNETSSSVTPITKQKKKLKVFAENKEIQFTYRELVESFRLTVVS